MAAQKSLRPSFLSVELDPIDARLDAKAAEKGIPTLVSPRIEETAPAGIPAAAASAALAPRKQGRGPSTEATPRSRMRGLKIELPDYVWVELKKQAAEEMVSLRHVIMKALRAKGIPINDADMVEDGRRLRN
jgi:hypothetical protein